MLMGKSPAVHTTIKKEEKAQINNLTLIPEKEQTKPKTNKQKEVKIKQNREEKYNREN